MNTMINDIDKIDSEGHSDGSGKGDGIGCSSKTREEFGENLNCSKNRDIGNNQGRGAGLSDIHWNVEKLSRAGKGWGTSRSKIGEDSSSGFSDGSKNNNGDSSGNG